MHCCKLGGNLSWYIHYGEEYGSSSSIKNKTTLQSSNSSSRYLAEKNKNTNLKRYVYPSVYCTVIYNSQVGRNLNDYHYMIG